MARIAKALATLREQVNSKWPNRSKVNDGWLGDAAHQARKSDHIRIRTAWCRRWTSPTIQHTGPMPASSRTR